MGLLCLLRLAYFMYLDNNFNIDNKATKLHLYLVCFIMFLYFFTERSQKGFIILLIVLLIAVICLLCISLKITLDVGHIVFFYLITKTARLDLHNIDR